MSKRGVITWTGVFKEIEVHILKVKERVGHQDIGFYWTNQKRWRINEGNKEWTDEAWSHSIINNNVEAGVGAIETQSKEIRRRNHLKIQKHWVKDEIFDGGKTDLRQISWAVGPVASWSWVESPRPQVIELEFETAHEGKIDIYQEGWQTLEKQQC